MIEYEFRFVANKLAVERQMVKLVKISKCFSVGYVFGFGIFDGLLNFLFLGQRLLSTHKDEILLRSNSHCCLNASIGRFRRPAYRLDVVNGRPSCNASRRSDRLKMLVTRAHQQISEMLGRFSGRRWARQARRSHRHALAVWDQPIHSAHNQM